ncbi:MAG: triose-phosphate isomerase [Neisseria sp.]|nr:triose-phosphate isomerase [Neisseria sp.]
MWHKKWIFGNWKMNGTRADNAALLQALVNLPENPPTQVGLAVPHPYLFQAACAVQETAIVCGAQDCSRFGASGAYTGETAAYMAADCGAQFVLIGHSERRAYFGEDNAVLRAKIDAALAAGLLPILCVGESLQEREAGREQEVVAAQLAVLDGLEWTHIAVAYEPVWAIGSGVVATVEQIAQMHGFIYENLLSRFGGNVSIRLLYGGSVNAANAQNILSTARVDGALVGGASLKADEFARIIAAVATE